MIGFFIVILMLLGCLLVIPYGITKMTQSEEMDAEFRNLFWQKAGPRARRILCTVLCFLPLMVVFRVPQSIEGWVLLNNTICQIIASGKVTRL